MRQTPRTRVYRLAAVAVFGAATLAASPLTTNAAPADATSCTTTQATASTDQDALNALLDQLHDAQTTLTQDQATFDELTKNVADDTDVISRYKALESSIDTETEATREAFNEVGGEALKALLDRPWDKVQEQTLELIHLKAAQELKDLTELAKAAAEGGWSEAAALEGLEGAQAAATLRFLSAPALLFARYVETADLAKKAVVLVADDAKLGLDLHAIESLDPQYQKAKDEIDTLQADLPPAQEKLAPDQSAVQTLTDEVNTAQETAQKALEAAAHACPPSPIPSDSPTPTPSTPGPPDHATTYGDPHLVTFDGGHYDFQQVGEFVLVKSTVDDFQIQVRQSPWAGTSQSVAENAAVAFEVAGHRVAVYATGTDANTMVDGVSITLADATPYPLPGGGSILRSAGAALITVSWPNGSVVTVGYVGGYHLTLDVGVAESEHGHLVGLLGNDDGDSSGDLVTRTGTVLSDAPTTADLYGSYSTSWRVSQAESLFDYAAGQNTGTFTDRKFPYVPATLPGLPTATAQSAAAICDALGVTAEPYRDDCILDVATTGDANAGLAELSAQTSGGLTTGNLVANGGFEVPSNRGTSYGEYYTGTTTAITGWTVSSGSIDIVSANYWVADQGTQSVDLAGSAPGSVSQTVITTPGKTYTLGWSLAGNVNCGGSVKTMDVEWNGSVVDAPTFDTTGKSNASMAYVHQHVTVTATGSSAQITFADVTKGDTLCGPVLDNVTLIPQG